MKLKKNPLLNFCSTPVLRKIKFAFLKEKLAHV